MTECPHSRVLAIWRCLRTPKNADQDWAYLCLDCKAYDVSPSQDAKIFKLDRDKGEWRLDWKKS